MTRRRLSGIRGAASACLAALVLGSPLAASEVPPGPWDHVIQNQDFTSTLSLDTGDDNTLILGCTFHDTSRGIELRNVSNVYIKDCTITNIREDAVSDGRAIVLRGSGSTDRVTIDGCVIHDVDRTGVMAHQDLADGVDHTNLVVKNNLIYNTGLALESHGLYIQVSDSLIENNVLYNSFGGNAISIRSSGVVRGNLVLGGSSKASIRYFGNKVAGPSNTLLVENNMVYETAPGHDNSAVVNLQRSSDGVTVGSFIVRFNTIVSRVFGRRGFSATSTLDPENVQVYGNLIVNTENAARILDLDAVDYHSANYTTTSLAGFRNAAVLPYDLHLAAPSAARGFATGEAAHPAIDFDGDARPAAGAVLDAGSDQYLGLIFGDGFEGGSTSAWTTSVP